MAFQPSMFLFGARGELHWSAGCSRALQEASGAVQCADSPVNEQAANLLASLSTATNNNGAMQQQLLLQEASQRQLTQVLLMQHQQREAQLLAELAQQAANRRQLDEASRTDDDDEQEQQNDEDDDSRHLDEPMLVNERLDNDDDDDEQDLQPDEEDLDLQEQQAEQEMALNLSLNAPAEQKDQKAYRLEQYISNSSSSNSSSSSSNSSSKTNEPNYNRASFCNDISQALINAGNHHNQSALQRVQSALAKHQSYDINSSRSNNNDNSTNKQYSSSTGASTNSSSSSPSSSSGRWSAHESLASCSPERLIGASPIANSTPASNNATTATTNNNNNNNNTTTTTTTKQPHTMHQQAVGNNIKPLFMQHQHLQQQPHHQPLHHPHSHLINSLHLGHHNQLEFGHVHKTDSDDLDRIRNFIEQFKARRGALGLTQKQAAQCFRAYTNDRYAFSDNFVGHFEGFQFRPQTAMTIADSLAEWLEFAESETRQGRQLTFMPGKVKETRKRKYEVIRIRDSAKRVLVEAFEKNKSPSTNELELLSKKTNIPSRNIEIFFKNRRTSRQYHQ